MWGNWEQTRERSGRQSGDAWKMAALAAAMLIAVGLSPAARADVQAGTPERGVRLSSVTGQVQVSAGGQVIADQALENLTLFEGTRLVTGEDGRAEVQFEDGSVARLSPNSSFTITVLKGKGTSGEAEVTLEMGLGYFELQGTGQAGAISVKFGDSAVTTTGFTVMRIDADEVPGQLAVFSGSAHLENSATGTVDVHGGESLKLKGKDGKYSLAETIEPDSWDAWNADRDQELNALAATQTGAANGQPDSGNPAWSDLDANGNWYNVPGEGQVWSPYEASNPGWGPYGNGYWVSTPGFGYQWVADDSWGYLPYSCGMWNWFNGFGWGWSPGAGGCSPWWFGGAYALNVGSYPGWWYAPVPPRGPVPPRRNPGPIHGRPGPVVAVNRHFNAPANLELPARDRGVSVAIAGATVAPLRPLSARPEYGRVSTGGTGTSGARPTVAFGVPGSSARAVLYSNPYAGAGAAGRTSYSSSVRSSSSSHSSSGGGHVSSGGGGGGGGHVSSGGGGGGGGAAAATHK
jgi:ferric-dicitrate binding protein FerR (iron transport regulator)